MTKKHRLFYLVLTSLFLTLAVLACGTGYRTTHKLTGDSGEIQVRMNEADGTDQTSLEINEDYFRERVTVTVTLTVESGNCRVSLVGQDGTTISLSSSAGSPAEVYGDLVTDGMGEIILETEAQGAKNVEIIIRFALK
jgi:hypothetical protein